jgi:hypothetical protein
MTMFLYASAIALGVVLLRYFHGRGVAAGEVKADQWAVWNRKAYRRAIGRWENEGGAVLARQNDRTLNRIELAS